LARCAEKELFLLVDLMLNPMESGSTVRHDGLFSLRQVSSVEKVENETDEEESAVGEVFIPGSCVL
jgi:hypothetical protein